MIKFVHHLILLLALIGLLSNCSNNKPSIEEDIYIKIVAELAILNAMSDIYMGEANYEQRREEILMNYNVSDEQFNSSHEFYQQQIPQQLERLQQVNIMLRQERDSIQQAERDFRRANREPVDSLRQRIRSESVDQ